MPSLSEVWQAHRYDPFPVLPALVLRGWGGLVGWAPAADFRLRILGFVVGLSIVAALWFNSYRLASAPPLVSLSLVAVNPVFIRYGDALRPYGMGCLFIVLAVGLFGRVFRAPTWKNTLAAACAAILSVQCAYMNAVLVLAMGLSGAAAALYLGSRRRAALILGLGMAAGLSLLPYAGVIRAAQHWAIVKKVPLSWTQISETYAQALGSTEAAGMAGPVCLWTWLALYFVGLPLSVYLGRAASVTLATEEKALAWYAVFLVMGATVGGWFFLKVASLPLQPWYYLAVVAVVASGFDTLLALVVVKRTCRYVAAAVALLLALIVVVPAYDEVRKRQTNIDLVASYLKDHAAKGDLVLVNPWYNVVSLKRYYQGPVECVTLPLLDDMSLHRYDLLKERMTEPDPLGPLHAKLKNALESGHHVWLVGNLPVASSGIPRLPPPAPSKLHEWNAESYLNDWRLITGAYLGPLVRDGRDVPVSNNQPINMEENSAVSMLEGWPR